ncbi:MAG: uroporphyrinogen-III C-methyltransferase [Burkholderiales bacterium]
MNTSRKGKVFLVGAGPGDPELLTLKAVRAIANADVILVDDLVNPLVLEHARSHARIVQVGKRGGCKSTPQGFIERLMVSEAMAGNWVVRLKGGDPFIFGRGGEELAILTAFGIDYEVLNGITAGIAAPTSIGIPLTHRDLCHGVAFITGHTKTDGSLPWQPVLAAGLTLVIYMGISNLSDIVAELDACGARATMPVAVIQDATLPSQRVLICTLETVVEDVAAHHLVSPSIIVIGEVVSLNRAAEIAEIAKMRIEARHAVTAS